MGIRFSFSEIDYSDTFVSRNYLITNFFYNKTECSHILFVDADMGFEHGLISEMVFLEEDLVGVVYPRCSIDLEKIHSHGTQPFKHAYAHVCSFIGSPGEPHPRNPAFRRVESCGTGILLISRRCIAQMLESCPGLLDERRYRRLPFADKFSCFITPFNKIELDDRQLSEDFSFCNRWTQSSGGKIYANTTCDSEHIGAITVKISHSKAT